MSTPHDYYNPHSKIPHMHTRGNRAVHHDPSWYANEAYDIQPLNAALGLGPRGKGFIPCVYIKDDEEGTFVLRFYDDDIKELFLESPNLHAGIFSCRTDDLNHKLYIDITRGGVTEEVAEMILPQGEEGTRIFVHKNNIPVEIEAKSADDLEYTFNAEDLLHQGQTEIEPRVYDTVLANIIWRKTEENEIEPDKSYFAAGIVQGVTRKDKKIDNPVEKVHVIFRTLYKMENQLQADYLQLDPEKVDYIKNRQFIETVENKISNLLQEPTDPEQYPTAMAVYKELERLRDTRAIAAVVESHEDMLNIPMRQLQQNDIVLVLHDETKVPNKEENKIDISPSVYWRYLGHSPEPPSKKKSYKKIPESWFEVVAIVPRSATWQELQDEIERAMAAEKQLQDNLDIETKDRKDADEQLQKNIDTETSQRIAADQAETQKRADEDEKLHQELDNERQARGEADAVLQQHIDEEARTRQTEDEKLQANIDAEAKTRSDTDTALYSHINEEQRLREEADKALDEAKLNKTDPHLVSIVQDPATKISTITDEKGNQTKVGGEGGTYVGGEYISVEDNIIDVKNLATIYDIERLFDKGDFGGLKLKATSDNSNIAYTSKLATAPDISISVNGYIWRHWDGSKIDLRKGDYFYIKGNNPNGLCTDSSSYMKFVINGSVEASGNLNSLLDNNDGSSITAIPHSWCYYSLFANCEGLITPPQLPATQLALYCYARLFEGCFNLLTAPELPAMSITSNCYYSMFYLCTSLTQAPELPATTLAYSCYYNMFGGCTSLTRIPELKATTLAGNCYNSMFSRCTSLKVNNSAGNKIFTCPDTTSLSTPVKDMFADTGGEFVGTPVDGETYYYTE